MADTVGRHSWNTELFHGAFTAPTPDVLTAVAEVIDIRGPGVEFSATKMTHLLSADKYHEYIPGFGDGGTIELTINFAKVAVAAIYALQPGGIDGPPSYDRNRWVVDLPDGSTWTMKGFISGFGNEVPEDDRITMPIKIKVSGKPVFVAGT